MIACSKQALIVVYNTTVVSAVIVLITQLARGIKTLTILIQIVGIR